MRSIPISKVPHSWLGPRAQRAVRKSLESHMSSYSTGPHLVYVYCLVFTRPAYIYITYSHIYITINITYIIIHINEREREADDTVRPNHRQHQLDRALPAGRAGGTSGTLEGHGEGAGCDAGSADGRAWCPIFKWEKDGKRKEK